MMMTENKTRIWEEDCVIPTYPVCPPEKAPLFLEKRAYQGSSGKVYPLPVTEKIKDEKEDRVYRAVYLENEYLKVMVLPELGGRIQRATDKTNNYDFVYYNHVIKPALVGLTGPWISGGIEFNWPQHHRPSTFSPVDYDIRENEDGSCTVYVSEIDKMYGTKGMAAISLYPGKAYIEIKGRLYNNTDIPQTFLWWANPAVPVNDHTYSVFPPDVNAVMDHGKRAVSTFPVATGEYYKWDYSAGVDISRYKNVKVPTSYMAAHSDYDFIGNYDEEREAGLLHVADHHVSPGKKQWTWGSGDFGRIWDKNLTDEDGPYIELMTGVFTDNQPDFTWLKPQEEKTFTQYFMPYKGVGRVGNATKDCAVSMEYVENGSGAPGKEACLKVYATGNYPGAEIEVKKDGTVIFGGAADLAPDSWFETVFEAPEDLSQCQITVKWNDRRLVQYSVYKKEMKPVPEPAEALKPPVELKSLEELYLAATHLEQYRHASYEPEDYYLEGLRRDPTDIRLNQGYGMLLFKRGLVKESIPYFEAAVKKQCWRNPNPYTGDCFYSLGLAYEADSQMEKAYDAFYKSTWSSETQSAGFYWLACLASRKGEYEAALEFVQNSLVRNWHNMKARMLKAAVLRKLGRTNSAFLEESLSIDTMYMGCLYEKGLADGSLSFWKEKMRGESHNYLTLALDYMKAGLYEEGLQILDSCEASDPMAAYYQAYCYGQLGDRDTAVEFLEKAEQQPADYCFPGKTEEIRILSYAIETLKEAPMASYYLGNLLYDKKRYEEAIRLWEYTAHKAPDFAMVRRNLSIACYNRYRDGKKAMEYMEQACVLDKTYPRFWLEYDQLCGRLNVPAEQRLAVMESHMEVTEARDDLYLNYITLLNCSGSYEKALSCLKSRKFHPWEGGEGKVSTQYRYALIHLAVRMIEGGKCEEAISYLTESLTYPEHLGEGKLPNTHDNEAYYYMGIAAGLMGDGKMAEEYFRLAASGSQIPEEVLYYNDQPSDYIFYQGLAFRKLHNHDAAMKSFHQLIGYGEKHLFEQAASDFFAVSLPELEVYHEEPQNRHDWYCRYLMALGHIGIEEKKKGILGLKEILAEDAGYQGAVSVMEVLPFLEKII